VGDGQDRLIDTTTLYASTIDKLNAEYDRLVAKATDGTLTFEQQNEVLKESIRVKEAVLKLEGELAEQSRNLAIKQAQRIALENGFTNATEKQLEALAKLKIAEDSRDPEAINKAIENQVEANKELADSLDSEVLNALKEAYQNIQEVENERLAFEDENAKILREIRRDKLEKDLDFAIDAFDTIKTVNERIIGDERVSLEQRRQIFNETNKLAEKSYAEQKKIIEQFAEDKINVDELIALSDEKVIRQRLKDAKLDETELTRA